MIIHKTRPEGAFRCRYEAEVYQLKNRKKVMYEANRELRVGYRYLIWSNYARVYYER